VRECAPEHGLTCVALRDFEDKIEIPSLSGLRDPRMNLGLGVLQAKPQRLVQRGARFHAIVDQTKVDPSLRLWAFRHPGNLAPGLPAVKPRSL
jgi:hypothetical protein